MKIFKKIKNNISKMIDESKERDKGKLIYTTGKKLTGKEPKLIQEGFYMAQRLETQKKKELEKIKRETEKLKLERQRDLAKLKHLKVKEKIKEQNKKLDNGGW